MASAYQDQDLDNQQSEGNALEMIESIKELIQAIEVENGRSRILYGRMLKVLSTEGRIILNIVREEYSAAPATQKTRMLCRLEERFEKLHHTLIGCKRFVDMLNRRGTILAIVFRRYDLKMMKALHEEVKKSGEEIERGITLLKTDWPSPSLQGVPPTTTTQVASSPTTPISHAIIQDAAFSNANNMYNRHVVDYSHRVNVVHVHGDQYVYNLEREGRERRH